MRRSQAIALMFPYTVAAISRDVKLGQPTYTEVKVEERPKGIPLRLFYPAQRKLCKRLIREGFNIAVNYGYMPVYDYSHPQAIFVRFEPIPAGIYLPDKNAHKRVSVKSIAMGESLLF